MVNNLLKPHVYIPPGFLSRKYSSFCLQSSLLGFMSIVPEQTAVIQVIPLHNTNCSVFITQTVYVYCAERADL